MLSVLCHLPSPFARDVRSADDGVPAWFLQSSSGRRTSDDSYHNPLKAGMFGVIRSLLRALEHGPGSKHVLDTTIDACSAMQNLREAISTYRTRLLGESKEHKRSAMLAVCLEYLERWGEQQQGGAEQSQSKINKRRCCHEICLTHKKLRNAMLSD